jgi:hypothetical protein
VQIARLASAAAVVLLLGGCGSDDAPSEPSASEPGDSTTAGIPIEPAACAGPSRDGTEEGRQYTWELVRAALADDPATAVWLGFSHIVTVDEVGGLPGDLTASGVQLVFEQQQGTYAKAQVGFDPVSVTDPALRQAAVDLLASSVGPPAAALPGIAPNVFDPVDPDVLAGAPPIAGLRVRGDIAAVIAADECLVFSLAPGDAPTGPEISPAIEPDPVRIDPG